MIKKSNIFNNNGLDNITFVDIFSDEYKDNYRIFTYDNGEIIFNKYYGLTFDEALENYFGGWYNSYNINLFFSIIKYCLENSKITDIKTNSRVARYTQEQVNFCLIALTEGFDYRDCYLDKDISKMEKVLNVMKEHKKEVKSYLKYNGSSHLLHEVILTDRNTEPLIGSHFWKITHDGEYFTNAMYRLGFDIRKDEKEIYLVNDNKYLCTIDENLIDEYYIDKLLELPIDKIVYCIANKANTNTIICYNHLSKYYDISIEDIDFLDCKNVNKLVELDKDNIKEYIHNLLVESKKKYKAIENLEDKLNKNSIS